jgi:hypothetical protein
MLASNMVLYDVICTCMLTCMMTSNMLVFVAINAICVIFNLLCDVNFYLYGLLAEMLLIFFLILFKNYQTVKLKIGVKTQISK